MLIKLRNPFKNLKACFARREKNVVPEEIKDMGKIAWQSINLENEPKIERKAEVA